MNETFEQCQTLKQSKTWQLLAVGRADDEEDRSAWPKRVALGQFLRADPGISNLLSFFYIWTHRFSTNSFLSVPPNGVGITRQPGARWRGPSCLYIYIGLLYVRYFSVLGSIHRSLAFVLEPIAAILDPSGATECVSEAVRIHRRPSAEKIFLNDHIIVLIEAE